MGLGPCPNRTIAKQAVRIVNTPETSTPLRFNGTLPTSLDWVGCQQVAQRFQPQIHTKHLFVKFVNSILSKLHCQQRIICFCMPWSLQYRLIWNRCFTYQGCQLFCDEGEDPRDALIANYATTIIVDAPLTPIVRMKQGACRCCLCQ